MPEKQEEVVVSQLENGLYQVSFFFTKKDMVDVQQGLNNPLVKMGLKGAAPRVGQVVEKLAAALKNALK